MEMVGYYKTLLIQNNLKRGKIKLGLIRIIKTYHHQLLKLRIIYRLMKERKIIRIKLGFVENSILTILVRNQKNWQSNRILRLIITYFKRNKKIQDTQLFNLMIMSGQLVVMMSNLSNNQLIWLRNQNRKNKNQF